MGQQGMGQQGMPPGYRFSPTDEELVVHYLKNRACGKDFHQGVIAEVDIYKHEPWDLPEKASLPSRDPVWYFFNDQDKRHSHTARINRTTGRGYWKATGKDRKICSGLNTVGVKKTLIYYEGRAPSGRRTDWIMHEYKLDEEYEKKIKAVCSAALCRIRKKGGPGPRNGEQYGAPLVNENIELGEDVEDDVDEKLPIRSYRGSECSVSSIKEPKAQGDTALQDLETEGCGSNDLSHVEGLNTNTELDLWQFLESAITDDAGATSFEPEMVSLQSVLDEAFVDHQQFDFGNNPGLFDIQDFLDVEGQCVDDVLHPISDEEQILGELLHLADGAPLHAGSMAYDADRTVAYSSGILDGDDFGPSGIPGDFLEIDDMNSPLDGLVMASPPQGSHYFTQEEQEPLFVRVPVSDYHFGSPDLLHTQGSAARRARLQIVPPPSVTRMHVNTEEQTEAGPNLHPKVQQRESSSNGNKHIVGGTSNENISILSSDSSSEAEEISKVVMSTLTASVFKQMSLYTVTKSEELPPQLFFAATSSQVEESSVNDSKRVTSRVAAMFSRQRNPTGIQEVSHDCETRCGSAEHQNANSRRLDVGVDCETGSDPIVRGAKSRRSVSSVVGELVSKVKSLTLGRRFVQLDSSVSTAFNDKVFALGKSVAQLVPSKDYANPYRSLRRGAMAALLRLAMAVFFLFILFLGVHMLSKFVLAMAART